MSVKSPLGGWFQVDGPTLSGAVFQVAGTIVALVLPAAEMGRSFYTKLEELLTQKVLPDLKSSSAAKARETFNAMLEEGRRGLDFAWRASVYALVSFLLASAGMVSRAFSMQADVAFALPPDDALAGLSLGFLIVSALGFFPAAWYAFSLESLERLKDVLSALSVPDTPKTEEKPAATPAVQVSERASSPKTG